jgi:hypothetical protein
VKVYAPVAVLLVSFVVASCVPVAESTRQTCSPQERASGVAPVPPVTPSPPVPEAGRAPKTGSPGIGTVPTPPDVPGPTEAPPRKEAPARKEDAAPREDKQAAVPTLDLASLEKRLRETKGIGFFTKLSLKNQVDDLREQFRAFHEGRSRATLAELRERYDLLLLKVLSVLQDSDPRLARDISASRDVFWGLLVDPVKFRKL